MDPKRVGGPKFAFFKKIFHRVDVVAFWAWESEAYFEVDGDYTIKFEVVDGSYENDTAIVVIAPLTDCDTEGLEAMESEVREMFETCIQLRDTEDSSHVLT